jgi:N-acetylglucosaminyldiphosphoundecaprenol N-acetyl-beta-D-mannosaminyltransferase
MRAVGRRLLSPDLATVEILGIPIAAHRFEEVVAFLRQRAEARRHTRIHFATVHTLVEATTNAALRNALLTADLVAADGVPLVWVSRFRGARHAERVCGPDVMPRLFDDGRADGLRHFLLGGRPGTPESLARRLSGAYPGVNIVGMISPPFRALSEDEAAEQLRSINEARADCVWVGLGTPKQDLWAERSVTQLNASLILTVGAAFDFHSGQLRRAPQWMRRLGLEWIFRLAMEPRRLLGRYAVTNSKFLILLAREELRRRRGRD